MLFRWFWVCESRFSCGHERREAGWPRSSGKRSVIPRSDRRGMGADCAVVAEAGGTGPQAGRGPARSAERDPLHDAHGRRLADASEGLSPWQTVYWRFRRFVRLLLFRTVHDIALTLDRKRVGRKSGPSAGVIDRQTVKAPAPGAQRGRDGARRTVGRKRHVAIDTDGRLPMVNLTGADICDSAGAQAILDALCKRGPWVGPRRWVVERTFAWLTRWRRSVRDYEQRPDVSEAP